MTIGSWTLETELPQLSPAALQAQSRAVISDKPDWGMAAPVTTIRFTSQGGPTFVDLKPAGGARDPAQRRGARRRPARAAAGSRWTTVAGANELVVDAMMAFRNDGEGLHRSVDPADGRHYVYGMSFMDAAPSIFACFDQPDLKAPYTFHVTAPADWVVIGNAPGQQVAPGEWELEPTQPLSTYFVTLVAGPYHLVRDEHDGIPLGLSARASIAKDLDADADELFTMTKQCFDEFHRLFGIRYPFGDYHQAFVPEFNAGAMENPGCVTFRDPLVFSSRVTRGVRIQRATTVAHEMAHQWFGNIVTPKWWDDLWLNESFAEYMGNRVTADVTEYDDAWTHNAYARRQWGLVADQRPSTHPVAGNGAVDASAALQDFDGISYAKGSSILKQLNARARRRGVLRRRDRPLHPAPLRQRHHARPVRELGGGRRGRPVVVHRQLAAHRRSGHDRAGPRRPASCAALPRPATPPTARTPSGSRPRRPGASGRSRRSTVDGRGDGRTTWPTGTAVRAGPLRGHLGAGPARRDHGRRAEGAAAGHRRHPAAGRGLEQRAQRLPQRRGRPGRRARPARGRAARSRTATTPSSTRMPWVPGKVVPLSADPAAALRRVHAAALRQGRDRRRPAPRCSSPRSRPRSARPPTPASCAPGWPGRVLPDGIELDLDLRWRMLVQLAVLGETDRDGAGRRARPPSPPPAPASSTRGRSPRCPTPRPRPGPGSASPARSTCPTTSSRPPGEGMWRRGQEHLTAPYVDRYFADAARHRRDAQRLAAGRRRRGLLPDHLADRGDRRDRARGADRRRGRLDLSLQRRLVDLDRRAGAPAGVRRAFPAR